jgi:formylglycine-generating enzyme required for sulfatase activity
MLLLLTASADPLCASSVQHPCQPISFLFGTTFSNATQLPLDLLPVHELSESDWIEAYHSALEETAAASAGLPEYTLALPGSVNTLRHLDNGIYPAKHVIIPPFELSDAAVSNADFAAFVNATGYVTQAETQGWSFIVHSSLAPHGGDSSDSFRLLHDPTNADWVAMPGASWRLPNGPSSSSSSCSSSSSSTTCLPTHPGVHVSFADAASFCKFAGLRLPGEREHEAAARAGYWADNWKHGSGDNDDAAARKSTNTFDVNGINEGTVPVRDLLPNALGFYGLVGNVWEWVRGGSSTERILRGASFLDSVEGDVGTAATVAARMHADGETSSSNIGFRCAKSVSRPSWAIHDDESVHEKKGTRYGWEL